MAPSQSWLDLHTAPTAEDLHNGDGCHRDEVQTLSDYLNNSITTEEAAEKITKPILQEPKPADETYRLWGLLCDALVELDKRDRRKTLDLLSHIRTLPATTDIEWSKLDGFASMWSTQYCGHLTGGDTPGVKDALRTSDEKMVEEFRQEYEIVGRTEAEMLVRGFNRFTSESCGYSILKLALSHLPGVEVYVSQILGWLDVAGSRLREKAMSDDDLKEKWVRWKDALLELSKEGSRLSAEGRKVAAQCHELM